MKKNGFSLPALIIGGAILSVGSLLGWQIGKPYMDARVVAELARNTLKEASDAGMSSEVEIRQKLFTKINVQGFRIPFESIEIRPLGGGEYELEVDMTTRVALWEGAAIVLDLRPKAP